MRAAAAAQEFEQAAVERNRLRGGALAARAPARRQRSGRARSTRSPSRVDGRDANAQVFQVRDGVLSDRQSFYLANETERDVGGGGRGVHAAVLRGAASVPALLVVQRELAEARRRWSPRRSRSRRGGAGRGARGRARREAADPRARRAQRARSRSTRSSCTPSAGASAASRRSRGCAGARRSTRCRCGSSASTSRTSAAPTRSPRWSCSRAARRRGPTTAASRSARCRGRSDDFASMAEVLRRRFAQWERQADISPARPRLRRELRRAAEPDRDRRRQGPARGRARRRCAAFASAGVAVISLAKRIEEVFVPGRARADRARPLDARAAAAAARPRRGPPLRDHPPPHPPRPRDDRSLLDELPGVGPARKRALLAHFGSPEAVLAASREQLQAVPGLPAKVGRELHAHLHRAG